MYLSKRVPLELPEFNERTWGQGTLPAEQHSTARPLTLLFYRPLPVILFFILPLQATLGKPVR